MKNCTHATIEPAEGALLRVYVWGTYQRGSVLEGQPYRGYIGEYATRDEALAALYARHPGLKVEDLDQPSSKPEVSLNHLPGEDDPVPGGMYPDDIGEWPPQP